MSRPFRRAAQSAFPESPISTPLSIHFSNTLSQMNKVHGQPSYRYRPPLPLLQKSINSVERPSHYCEKWFHQRTGVLSNALPVESIWPATYFSNVENELNVPTLQHGLDRVVNSGQVHVLQNFQDSTMYFDEFLRDVSQPETLDYGKMAAFRPPSKDAFLHNLGRMSECTFAASTSSMTGALSAFYLLLSNFKPPYANVLPSFFHSKKFTHFTGTILDKPRFLVLRPQTSFEDASRPLIPREAYQNIDTPRIYALDSDSFPFIPVNLILTKLGHSLERALTYKPKEFGERFVRDSITNTWEDETDQAYHYTKFGNFLVRSQLDCFDASLREGRGGIFDLKTRATAPIRFNMKTYDKHIQREQLTHFVGRENSFEKEFHDMVRNALIKYSYQGLLGRMDGMFLAYHNTSEMYGFEYLPLEEINTYVFGSDFMARRSLLYSIQLVNEMCQRIVDRFPNQPVRLVIRPVKHQETKTCQVIVYAHVLGDDQGWKEFDQDVEIEAFFEDANPFHIPDDVVGFRIGTHVVRNGRPVHHELTYRETDDVQVEYFIEELSNKDRALSLDVIRMMKLEAMASAPGKAAYDLALRLRNADLQQLGRGPDAMN